MDELCPICLGRGTEHNWAAHDAWERNKATQEQNAERSEVMLSEREAALRAKTHGAALVQNRRYRRFLKGAEQRKARRMQKTARLEKRQSPRGHA